MSSTITALTEADDTQIDPDADWLVLHDTSAGSDPKERKTKPANLIRAVNRALTEVSITTTTTLDGTAFGRMHVLSGTSADYTVTLPSASGHVGEAIGLRGSSSLTKVITLAANGSETINGEASKLLWANESVILVADAAGWHRTSGIRIAMVCMMHLGTSQNISSASMTQLGIDQVDIDSAGMANAPGNQIVIRRPGRYRLVCQVYHNGLPGAALCLADIWVNGSQAFETSGAAASGENSVLTCPGIVLDLSAGDTVDVRAYQNSGSTNDVAGGATALFTFLLVEEILT